MTGKDRAQEPHDHKAPAARGKESRFHGGYDGRMSAVRETSPESRRARQAEIAGRIGSAVPPASVLVDREDLKPYECDGLSAYRETPLVAVLPADEVEAAAVLEAARATGTPVVARGSGTGLSGGRVPLADGILLSLARFNRVSRRCRRAQLRACSPASPTCGSRSTWRRSASTTRPILEPDRVLDRRQRRENSGRRALPQVRASRCTTSCGYAPSRSRARCSRSAPRRSTRPGYDLLALVTGSEGLLA
jgi:hypothetical protein